MNNQSFTIMLIRLLVIHISIHLSSLWMALAESRVPNSLTEMA